MHSDGRIFSPPKIPSQLLYRAIKQQFMEDGARHASLTPLRGELGPGWLYHLDGRTYYSPTCYRPNVKVPLSSDANMTQDSAFDNKFDRYRNPQWWNKASAYLAFVPLRPDLSAPPLYPLLRKPDIVEDAEVGPRPDPIQWAQWKQLQEAITVSCHLLLKDSGAPAVRSIPYPCARVDRSVLDKAYVGRKGRLYHDISSARPWFEVWLGCLSYAIAVNEAIINQVNTFNLSSSFCVPLSWIELLLIPSQNSKSNEMRPPHSLNSSHAIPHWSAATKPSHLKQDPTITGAAWSRDIDIVDPIFVSSLRDTCIANFDGSVERVGLFIEIPDKPEEMVSIDWLVECKLPVWYAWGTREESIAKRYPILARYRPPADAIWAVPPPPQLNRDPLATPNHSVDDGDNEWTDELDSMVGPLSALELSLIAQPKVARYEKRRELREYEKTWEGFFAAADSRAELLIRTETPQMKQDREARRHNPPSTRPEAKFYVWERGMRGKFRRRIATDDELDALFQEKGQFGRKQARYNDLFNEWDLCRYWGPPDDNQLVYRSEIRANMRGTTMEEELIWWRVYYGLQPEPSNTNVEDTSDYHLLTGHSVGSPEHDLDPGQWNAFDMLTAEAGDASGFTSDMEVGEIRDPEVALEWDLSWIGRHAYNFFGFTMPLGMSSDESSVKSHPETPAHAPRLIGVPSSQATARYWMTKEGQAIICFAKSLATKDPPEPSSWDLHRWNAMPIATLPLFKKLKSFQGRVVVQVEKWDNVRGRITPELVPHMESAYWLDVTSKDSQSNWYIGVGTPELALALCRLGASECDPDPLAMAWYLATKGVPFYTWFKRRPDQIQPLAGVRTSPQLIQFRLESQYQFGGKDYREYVLCRRRLLDGPAGPAAVRMGGIVWKLATDDVGIRDALSGLPSEEALCGQRVVRRDDEGGFLVDHGLNQDEIMAICGEYEVGIGEFIRPLDVVAANLARQGKGIREEGCRGGRPQIYGKNAMDVAGGRLPQKCSTSHEWRRYAKPLHHLHEVIGVD